MADTVFIQDTNRGSTEQGAAEGALFIASHMIDVIEGTFDDFAGGTRDDAQIEGMLGL